MFTIFTNRLRTIIGGRVVVFCFFFVFSFKVVPHNLCIRACMRYAVGVTDEFKVRIVKARSMRSLRVGEE